MKISLYKRMALGNLRKYYRFFVPRILAETGLLACFYIILTLALDRRLSQVKGGSFIPSFMAIGAVVIGLLSLILMLYINSFLMKQRKREFGLYTVLGMEKKHVGRVLFYESFFSSILSVLLGIVFGILFYKLASLLICKLLATQIVIGFYFISLRTILPAAVFFLLLDLLTYFVNRISIARMKPVQLLASKHYGEKEPKNKWILLLLGLASLAAGYYIAVTTENPLSAIEQFFNAVFLVIIGTYFLFVSGSVFVLKLLRRNKKYYYQKNHMTTVSGLLYRMKQNAVGLASIAILATGVLVMLSTTICLYNQIDTLLSKYYPYQLYIGAEYYDGNNEHHNVDSQTLQAIAEEAARKNGLTIEQTVAQEAFSVSYVYRDGQMLASRANLSERDILSDVCSLNFITEDTYTGLGGTALHLQDNEIAVYKISGKNHLEGTSLQIHDKVYQVRSAEPISLKIESDIFDSYVVILPNGAEIDRIYAAQQEAYGEFASTYLKVVGINFSDQNIPAEKANQLESDLSELEHDYIIEKASGMGGSREYINSIWQARESIFGMYGTLLFLGILLGMVCLFATALVIYYKQISEGYEDRERFQIMQKIGMSSEETRKTIRSQILMVFFLPLIVAGVHCAFAFPILSAILKVMMLRDVWIFLVFLLITYTLFAVVYAIIYLMTAKTYYKIVH